MYDHDLTLVWCKNPGKAATMYNARSSVSTTHQKSMTPATLMTRFKKEEISFDLNVFTDADFLCNYVTSSQLKKSISCGSHDSKSWCLVNWFAQRFASSRRRSFKRQGLQWPNRGPGPSHVFLSPEEFRGYPKAGEQNLDQKQRKKKQNRREKANFKGQQRVSQKNFVCNRTKIKEEKVC